MTNHKRAAKKRYEYWRGIVEGTWSAPKEAKAAVTAALVEAAENGTPSCLLHEIHRYHEENVMYPECPHCGGAADPRVGFHHLCREYAKRGMPIRKLDVREPCPCTPCTRNREETT